MRRHCYPSMSWYFEFDYNSIAIWPIHDVICILCYILHVSAFALRSSSVLVFHLILREYHFIMATVWTLDVYQNWLKITNLLNISSFVVCFLFLYFVYGHMHVDFFGDLVWLRITERSVKLELIPLNEGSQLMLNSGLTLLHNSCKNWMLYLFVLLKHLFSRQWLFWWPIFTTSCVR